MTNELDELMSLDPLNYTTEDIDKIIAVHRRNRAQLEAGVKPKREKGPSVKIDLAALGLGETKPKADIKRRV